MTGIPSHRHGFAALFLTSRENGETLKVIHPPKDMTVFFFRGDGIIEIIES